MGKPMVWGSRYLYPICSIFRENVGKYSIHGAYMGILGNLHMQNKAAHNKRNATEFDSSWWETQFSSVIERHQQHQHASSSPRMGNAPMGNTFDSVPWNAVCYWTACQFVSLPFKPAWESVDMESASLTLKTKSLCVCVQVTVRRFSRVSDEVYLGLFGQVSKDQALHAMLFA